MSSCNLRIEWERKARTFVSGAQVQGRVVVTPEKSTNCKALTIELAWETHGRGNKDQAVLQCSVERNQVWEGGQTYTYPFAFPIPHQPLTYHGELLNVDYYVRARADLPWALDPKTQEDFLVEAGPGSREAYLAEALNAGATNKSSGCVLQVLGWMFLLLFVIPLLMLFAIILPILLIILSIQFILRRLAEGKVGKVTVAIDAPVIVSRKAQSAQALDWARKMTPGQDKPESQTYVISPGQPFGLGLEFRPRMDVSITKLVAVLHGWERCRSGSGSNAKTHTHDLYKEELLLAEDLCFRAGELTQRVVQVPVPNLDAFSFEASDNHLEWQLTVHFDIPGWPDWKQDYKLRMVPK